MTDGNNQIQLRYERPLVATVLLFFLYAFCKTVILAGLQFPPPWPDEAHFLWQSIAFADHGTLSAPELNSARPIMWMPPMYLVAAGIWLKAVGIGLLEARLLSLFFMAGNLFLLYRILSFYGLKIWIAVLIGVMAMSPAWVATGNVARPEALLILLTLTGLYLIQRHNWLTGVAVLALLPLIHANGVLLAAGGVLYALIERRNQTLRGRRLSIAFGVLSFALICWLAYAWFVSVHWEAFLQDMQYQWARKAGRHIWGNFLTISNLVPAIAVGLVVLLSRLRLFKLPALRLLVLAVPAWFVAVTGGEMWYEIFRNLAVMIVAAITLHLIYTLSIQCGGGTTRRSRIVLMNWGLALTIAVVVLFGYLPSPLNYVRNFEWLGMKLHPGFEYITPGDRKVIAGLVESATVGKSRPRIDFFPAGDGIIMADEYRDKWQFRAPVFDKTDCDLLVFHNSRVYPSWWRFMVSDKIRTLGIESIESLTPVYERDSTERWYLIDRRGLLPDSGISQ